MPKKQVDNLTGNLFELPLVEQGSLFDFMSELKEESEEDLKRDEDVFVQDSDSLNNVTTVGGLHQLYARPIYNNYAVFFFQTCAVPHFIAENINDEKCAKIKQYSRFRVDAPSARKNVEENEKRIYSLALRLLNRGQITYNSENVDVRLKDLFDIEAEDSQSFNLDSLDNYINYSNVKNPTDPNSYIKNREDIFIDILRPILGSNWASHIITQAYLDSIAPQKDERLNSSDQRVDFLISQNNINLIIELDGKDHIPHKDKDNIRDKRLRDEGYKVIRKDNSCIDTIQGQRKLIEELKKTGLIHTEKLKNVSLQDKLFVASKLIHQIQVAVTKCLEQGILSSKDSFDLDLKTNFFDQDEISTLLSIALDDLEKILINFAKFFDLNLNFKLENAPQNDSRITIRLGNSVSNSRELVIRDVSFKDDFVCQIEPFEFYDKVICDKNALRFFLNYIFRFADFWEGQYEAMERLLSKRDSIVLLPTGSGKSLVYQLTSFIVPGQTMVVCPIVSLMDDQIDNLKSNGIDNALAIYYSKNGNNENNYDKITCNNYSLIYVSPERMQIASFRNAIGSSYVYSVAIDEAHCVSEWGHEFRTAYLNIGKNSREILEKRGTIPVLTGLTGTASMAVLKDVKRELSITGADSIVVPKTFDRKELKFSIYKVASQNKFPVLKNLLLKDLPQKFNISPYELTIQNHSKTYCGIVFCQFVNKIGYGVATVKNNIEKIKGFESNVGFYSGSKPNGVQNWEKERRLNAFNFKRNRLNILVATKAFGMGIDKPNIRYTIHYGISASIEAFYQEAGRAGRDGERAECSIIFSNDNGDNSEKILDQKNELRNVCIYYEQSNKNSEDDVSRNLYFHLKSFKGVEIELKNVGNILHTIFVEKKQLITNEDKADRDIFEKAIQRLVVLGIIDDYTVNYSSQEYSVSIGNTEWNSITDKYCDYVKGYSKKRVKSERARMIQNQKLAEQKKNSDLWFYYYATKTLIEFIYETVEQGRRRGLREMFLLAKSASRLPTPEEQDREIRTKIKEYFDLSYSDEIDAVQTADDLGLEKIKEIFNTIKEDGMYVASAIRNHLPRYLESMHDHPGLLFLRGLTEYYSDNADRNEVKSDFNAAISSAVEKYSCEEQDVIDFIIFFLKKICEREQFSQISKADSIYPSLLEIAFKYFDKLQLCKMIIDKCENKEMINLTMLVYMEIQSENLISIINQKRR